MCSRLSFSKCWHGSKESRAAPNRGWNQTPNALNIEANFLALLHCTALSLLAHLPPKT